MTVKMKNGLRYLLIDIGIALLVTLAERVWKAAKGWSEEKQSTPEQEKTT